MILVVDNGDTKRVKCLINYLKEKNCKFKLIQSIDDMVTMKNVHGIILSGSPVMINGEHFLRDQDIFFSNAHALHKFAHVPILGICFGSQFLNVVWGGELQKLENHVCGSVPVKFHKTKETYDFHFCCRYAPKKLPDVFREVASATLAGKKVPCIFRHKTLPIFGSLCHPEGLKSTHWFLDDFLDICYRKS